MATVLYKHNLYVTYTRYLKYIYESACKHKSDNKLSFHRSFSARDCKMDVRESAKFIAKNAKYVEVHDTGVKALANEVVKHLKDGSLNIGGFSQCEIHPQDADEKAIDWLFVVDTLNFCFWSASPTEKWTVTWKNKSHTGYFALCAAINRAIDEGYAITDPKYYSQITVKDLSQILRSDNELFSVPLLKERQECLHEVGLVLLEKFEGRFVNCITEAKHSAKKLLQIIADNFPCFRDESVYNGEKVALYKRAQILIGDIWACFKGKELGHFTDIDQLTMFADYRVPQVLVHFNAMKYSNELMETLKKGNLLASGSEEEVEIRGCSIHAVELVLIEIKKLLPDVVSKPSACTSDVTCNSIMIDHFLWDYRRKHAEELEYIPFHKTLGIFY